MNEFNIGVVSGLVTSLIIFVFQLGYIRIFRPWLEELLYRDLRIEGRWLANYPENEEISEVIELQRRGHEVSGIATVTGGPDLGRTYTVAGTFKNLILTLSFSGQDKTRLDRGSYTLQVQSNGQVLLGYSAFYQDDENKITAMTCSWERN